MTRLLAFPALLWAASACDDGRSELPGATHADAGGDVAGGSDGAGGADGGGRPGCVPEAESCNGRDDDCDGSVDEDREGFPLAVPCYDGAEGTEGIGRCLSGGFLCVDGAFDRSVCKGQVGPTEELCDAEDNDCDGEVDESDGELPLGLPCWEGDEGLEGVGRCRAGVHACRVGRIDLSSCIGQIGPATDHCDGIDNDCDGELDEGCDLDEDGFCAQGLIAVEGAACRHGFPDCDDGDPEVHPGADEVCDGIDNDCDGDVDPGCDDDEDGWCALGVEIIDEAACPEGPGDCDDGNPLTFPGAFEPCDGVDHNCDGAGGGACDADEDGFCGAGVELPEHLSELCPRGGGDCNDADPAVNPGAEELICNGVDDDCDGLGDDHPDGDEDGFDLCENGVDGADDLPADCDDGDAGRSPGRAEVECNGFDEDCDGSADDHPDADADDFDACPPGVEGADDLPVDCDDERADVHPGHVEICDLADNDCDGITDRGCDDDGDGWCDAEMEVPDGSEACEHGGGDCDDRNRNVHPGRDEICDGVDQDCDEGADEGCDDDEDGACDADMEVHQGGVCPRGGGDCDDRDPRVRPGLEEVCDDLDNNCLDGVDDGCDDDDDGFCDEAKVLIGRPFVCLNGQGDCDDGNAEVHPDRVEARCNGLDDDCDPDTPDAPDRDEDGADVCGLEDPGDGDGLAEDCDDRDGTRTPGAPELCDDIDNDCDGVLGPDELDGDHDGVTACDGDCEPEITEIRPGALELCNGVDENCDQHIDEGDPGGGDDCGPSEGQCTPGTTRCDGGEIVCGGGAGPGVEVCGDGLDQACVGAPDSGCPVEGPVIEGSSRGEMFGWAISGVEDVDDDDLADLIVGAPTRGARNEGRACLVSGADGDTIQCWNGGSSFGLLGFAVAGLTDADHDGYADLAIGSPRQRSFFGQQPAGTVFIMSGSELDLLLRVNGRQEGDEFGAALLSLGDQTGNGQPELVVGAWSDDFDDREDAGSVHILHLGHDEEDDLAVEERMRIDGIRADYRLGRGLALLPDMDGDGLDDFVAGATQPASRLEGLSSDSGERLFTLEDERDVWWGVEPAAFEDWDGDGLPEVCVGAPYASSGGLEENGEVGCWSGGAGDRLLWRVTGDATGGLLGWALEPVDDQDGDGIPDLLAGAPERDVGDIDMAGEVRLLSGADGSIIWVLRGTQRHGRFGRALDIVGDVDGDGIPDLAVGAPGRQLSGEVPIPPRGWVHLLSMP